MNRRKSDSPDLQNNDPPQSINSWNEIGSQSTRVGRRRDAGASMDFNSHDLFSNTGKKVDGVNQREFDSYNDANEIPEIPDLDEYEGDGTEDMAFQVAEAPEYGLTIKIWIYMCLRVIKFDSYFYN